MEFIDPKTTPFIPPQYRGQLPHLYKPGGIYFATFRLADAVLPQSQRRASPKDAAEREYKPEEIDQEPPLTLGSCALQQPQIADLVKTALFAPLPGFLVSGILQS